MAGILKLNNVLNNGAGANRISVFATKKPSPILLKFNEPIIVAAGEFNALEQPSCMEKNVQILCVIGLVESRFLFMSNPQMAIPPILANREMFQERLCVIVVK